MRLLIVRHAESMGNATGDYSIVRSDSLSEKGHEQAVDLAEELLSMDFNKIIVSSLQRAQQTITPYLRKTQQRAEIWPELSEACWHPEREDPADSWKTQPAPLSAELSSLFYYRDDKAVQPSHPESFGAGLRRVHETFAMLEKMAASSAETVLMVSHGHVIREILNLILRTDLVIRFPHDNCGMTMVSFDGDRMLEFCNRTTITEAS